MTDQDIFEFQKLLGWGAIILSIFIGLKIFEFVFGKRE